MADADEDEENFDIELYGDLDDNAKLFKIAELEKLLRDEIKKNEILTKEKTDLQKQINELVMEKAIVERNLVQLYDTALVELSRKEKEIENLQMKTPSRRENSSKYSDTDVKRSKIDYLP